MFDLLQVLMCIKSIFMNLCHTNTDIGTVICHTLQAGSHIGQDESHFNGTFSGAKSLDMPVLQFLAEFIDHFLQRLDLSRKLHILIFVNLVSNIYNVFHRMLHDPELF